MTSTANASAASEAAAVVEAREGKYLTFELAGEIFGLEILKVQEIIGMMTVTRVPKTPDFIRGVINLRGKVIPVVDLRLKFGMQSQEDTERTCIIVVQVTRSDRQVTMGILVDAVSEVQNIVEENIEDTPSFGASVETDFILGMGKVDQKVVMLLDIDKVLSGGDMSFVDQVSQQKQ